MVDFDVECLKGLQVLDLGQVIAGSFASVLLADYGAEVIKVEKPGVGDNMRVMGVLKDGVSLQFTVENRSKKSISLDLQSPKGKELFLKLLKDADVVIENFAPGTMEKMGLGYDVLESVNPRIILGRISGYGQTGPKSRFFGYDRIAMAYGGLTYLTGFSDRPPLRAGLAIADYMAGMLCAFGVMCAVYNRDVIGTGKGQVVDQSLYEAIFRCMEGTVVNYKLNGEVRERSGNRHILSTPGEHYLTKDEKWIVIAVASDRNFEKFCKVINREDLLQDPRFAKMPQRSKNEHKDIIEEITAKWVAEHTREECFKILEKDVPVAPILSIADMVDDEHFVAREDIVTTQHDKLGEISMQGVFPKLSRTPGAVKWGGPSLGSSNVEIYKGKLGLTEEEYNQFVNEGVI